MELVLESIIDILVLHDALMPYYVSTDNVATIDVIHGSRALDPLGI